jgi:hypothetical protein
VTLAKPVQFAVETDSASGGLVAAWDDPAGHGGITTQTPDLERLITRIREAASCHFDAGEARLAAGFHLRFTSEPVLVAS